MSSGMAAAPIASRKQQRLEGSSEVDVEHSIDDGVHCGVDVAESVRIRAAFSA